MSGWSDPIIKNLCFPCEFTGNRIKTDCIVVVCGVDDEAVVNCNIAVVTCVAADVFIDVFWKTSLVCPDQVASLGVDGMDRVTGLGHVQYAVVGKRCAFLRPTD